MAAEYFIAFLVFFFYYYKTLLQHQADTRWLQRHISYPEIPIPRGQLSSGMEEFKWGRLPIWEAKRTQRRLTECPAWVTRHSWYNLTSGYGTTHGQGTLTPWILFYLESKDLIFHIYGFYFFTNSLCIFSYIWKHIKWKNKDDSVDKFMKKKFLNHENLNYIRKHPNHENFSRCKITGSHNPEK